MDEAVAEIFETCLQRIAAGATVEECLVAYPAERPTLEPLLRAATRLQALPRPAPLPAAAQAALATRVLSQVTSARSATASVPQLGGRPAAAPGPGPSALLAGALRAIGYRGPLAQPWLRLGALALALALALTLAATAYAAVRALFPPAPDAPAALAPATSFELEGAIETVSEAGLVVAGIAVDLGPQTVITGTPAVGATAQVRGQIRDDGTLLAEAVVIDTAVATGGSPTVSATTPPAASATSAPVAVATAASPSTAEPVAPTAEPTVASPPEPTAAPPPEPTVAPPAAPTPSGDPLVQLRQLLEAGVADGRAGEQGREFLNKLSEAERALAERNSQKAGDQLRDLYQKLREQAREGKTDPAFAQEAQALIAAAGELYGLRSVPDEEGGGGGNGGGNDDKEDKDDKKDE